MYNKLLLTGVPGVGKTYLLNKVINALKIESTILLGFTTQEITDNLGNRIAFELVSVKNPTDRKILSSLNDIEEGNVTKFGRWNVSVDSITYFSEKYMKEPENRTIFILDEIGPMQCQSKEFMDGVRRLLQSKCIIIGTIKLTRCGIQYIDDFIAEVKSILAGNIMTITLDNRDIIYEDIMKMIFV